MSAIIHYKKKVGVNVRMRMHRAGLRRNMFAVRRNVGFLVVVAHKVYPGIRRPVFDCVQHDR